MLKRIFLLSICVFLLLSLCRCNCNKTVDEDSEPDSSPSIVDTPVADPVPIPIPTCSDTDTIIIKQTNVIINDEDHWLDELGINKNAANTPGAVNTSTVVNAANAELTGGSGIDEELLKWLKKNGRVTPWKENTQVKSPEDSSRATSVDVGKYAVCPTSFGNILLAVGPNASQVNTLQETSQIMEDLYYNMLKNAHDDSKTRIVLCAVSTGLSAGAGKEKATGKTFTKEQFICTMYNGAHAGINKFKTNHSSSTLEIILNNWDPS